MSIESKISIENSVPEPPSLLAGFIGTQFALKRRSSPSAAFAEIFESFSRALRKDCEMAKAFAIAEENFKGIVLNQEDAIRLATLNKRGADQLGIEIAGLPQAMSPGLCLMYDAALETLKSTDLPIKADMINARAICAVGDSLVHLLPHIGKTTLTALELALDDDDLAGRLRKRSSELGTSYLLPLPTTGFCENCEITIFDEDGNISDQHCGTKEECRSGLLVIIILVLIWLLGKIWDWI